MRKADQHQNKALWGEESRSKQHRIDDEWRVRLEAGPQVTHMQMQSVSEWAKLEAAGAARCGQQTGPVSGFFHERPPTYVVHVFSLSLSLSSSFFLILSV
ncbi:hypothetical protein NW759_000253 [Fusarium solani]|jgi:hypothetical protein|nr:hypothetical protein NW759_000253 [Fusarium solani]